MSIKDYRDCVKTGSIIDYDGCGAYIDDNGKECGDSDFNVKAINKRIKQGIHWVCWYNK